LGCPFRATALLDGAGPLTLGYQPGFWVTFRNASYIQLLRYYDTQDSPTREPFLRRALADRLITTSSSDVRSMATDDSTRRACETGCGVDSACLEECAR